jgi:hypothetical protein
MVERRHQKGSETVKSLGFSCLLMLTYRCHSAQFSVYSSRQQLQAAWILLLHLELFISNGWWCSACSSTLTWDVSLVYAYIN